MAARLSGEFTANQVNKPALSALSSLIPNGQRR